MKDLAGKIGSLGLEEAFEALRKFGPLGAQRKDWAEEAAQSGGTFNRTVDELKKAGRITSPKRGVYVTAVTARPSDETVH